MSIIATVRAVVAAALCSLSGVALAADAPTYGPELEGFAYPYPLQHFRFVSQGVALQMAYMDVALTAAPNGRTAVLMHGKNSAARRGRRRSAC